MEKLHKSSVQEDYAHARLRDSPLCVSCDSNDELKLKILQSIGNNTDTHPISIIDEKKCQS